MSSVHTEHTPETTFFLGGNVHESMNVQIFGTLTPWGGEWAWFLLTPMLDRCPEWDPANPRQVPAALSIGFTATSTGTSTATGQR